MICVHVTSSAKGHSMQSLSEAYKYKICKSLPHTCTWLYVCTMYSCMPTTLSLAHLANSNHMPQHMYSVCQCAPMKAHCQYAWHSTVSKLNKLRKCLVLHIHTCIGTTRCVHLYGPAAISNDILCRREIALIDIAIRPAGYTWLVCVQRSGMYGIWHRL